MVLSHPWEKFEINLSQSVAIPSALDESSEIVARQSFEKRRVTYGDSASEIYRSCYAQYLLIFRSTYRYIFHLIWVGCVT